MLNTLSIVHYCEVIEQDYTVLEDRSLKEGQRIKIAARDRRDSAPLTSPATSHAGSLFPRTRPLTSTAHQGRQDSWPAIW